MDGGAGRIRLNIVGSVDERIRGIEILFYK
jgi:hypothetical protein